MLKTHYIAELSKDMNGQEVLLAGWIHQIRETGNLIFLLLRDSTGIVQIVGKKGETDKELLDKMLISKESVILVKGIIKTSKEAKLGFEIIPKEIIDLNPLSANIPFEITGKVPIDLDTRLDYRQIDLRRKEPRAIFKIESTILNTFTEVLAKRGFEQIRTPSIISEASEGGAEVFPVTYFDKEAYLAQSPQLYKQLAVIGGMEKVFMIMPVFRAENSNTVWHLNEITQMDIEVAFADADDVISILIDTVKSIIMEIKKRNSEDLETLGVDLKVPDAKIVTYEEAIKQLKSKGHKIELGDDFSRTHEKGLEEIYGDAVVVKDFPAKLRAFYSMPKKDSPELTNSFDYIYKGAEICSGAQRIHIPELLIESLKKKGMDPKAFNFYINSFRSGAPPHAGWSIGLERIAMQITDSKNIRECVLFPRDRKRLTP
jgi:aspartyl-tRNA synthetase